MPLRLEHYRRGDLSLGFVVVLEREIEGIDPRIFDGRRLAAHRHMLDSIAHDEDLRGLGEFVAFSRAEAEALAEDMKFDAPAVGHQSGRWFSATTALEVIRAIHGRLVEEPDEWEDAASLLTDLDAFETILAAAEANGIRFRLGLDY